MAGYREITVASEGRVRRPARASGSAVPARRNAGWRGVAVRLLRHGLAEGKVLCREKPGSVFGGVVAVVAAGFVCVNALSAQKGRHPAPILPKVAAKAPAPAPARQEVVREAAKEPVPPPAPKQAPRDQIGDLIRAEDTTASVNPRAKPSSPQPTSPKPTSPKPTSLKPAPAKPEAAAPTADPAVARAQRALTKLGYGPVKADGALGPATRAAIQKFERDRKLPVTGEAAGRTLRALETGVGKG